MSAPKEFPPVTILKPLKGVDASLEKNLESFFKLDYPEVEILLCVGEETDPAYDVARKIVAKYPLVKARIFVNRVNVGLNPKVNNLMPAYEEASHDLLLISDSNTRVKRNFLTRLVTMLEPGVGLVSAMIVGKFARGMGGRSEALFLNTFYARVMHLGFSLGMPVVMGKAMLFRKSTSQRFGGIKTLANYIAEDHVMGVAIQQLGLRVKLMIDPIEQYIGDYSLNSFVSRHIRWGRILKSQLPFAFFAEPLGNAVMSGIAGALAFSHWFSINPFVFFLAHLAIWYRCDFLLVRRIAPELLGTFFRDWVIQQLLFMPLWARTACGSSVEWRGNRFKILPGGLLHAPC